MCSEDSHFTCMIVVALFKLNLLSHAVTGHMEIVRGEWLAGRNAGGSRNNLVKFATNDQYLLTLTDPGELSSLPDPPENCHLNVKKLPKTGVFFFLIDKNCHFFNKIAIFFNKIAIDNFVEKMAIC